MENEPRYLIIPAAGLGTRMRNFNAELPKEMLPVGNRPAIQHALEEGFYAGIKDIVIVINRQKEIIRKYFEDKEFRKNKYPLAAESIERINKECSITFLYQDKPSGEADAIGLAGDIVGSHCTAIIYPDNIYTPVQNESPVSGALNRLKSVFRQYKTDIIALMEVTAKNAPGISNSGRVDIQHVKDSVFKIEKLLPKGKGCFIPRHKGELRTCGISISGPYIFEYINRLRSRIKEKEFTDVPVKGLIQKEKGLLGCRLPGTVFDIGNPAGYKQCLRHIKSFEF